MKKLFATFSDKWAEYLLEVLVITFGILFAFLLNSWNESRKMAAEERHILEGLKEEFTGNLNNVTFSIETNTRANKASHHLMDLIQANTLFADSDLTDSLLISSLLFSTFDAQNGYTEEIINSGKLSILKDQKLKTQLTNWSTILANSQEDYDLRVGHYNDHMIGFLVENFSLSNFDQYMDLSPWSNRFKHIKRPKSKFSSNTEVDLRTFENLLWAYKFNNDYVTLNEIEVKAYVLATLELIDSNIK